jgi:3-hydroxybutyryl-CoA dehydrogenase
MTSLAGTTVAVVGLGAMGRGIARVFARAGATVLAVDADRATTDAGVERTLSEAARDDLPGEVRPAASLAGAAGAADLLVEAIVEQLDAKLALMRELAAVAGEELVVATNTSSLSVAELGVAFGDPGRVVGLHFFNPAHRMRLVEVVHGPGTRPDVLARAEAWVASIGKTAVVCRDSPNFVVNRICRPLYYEAQLLATQGVPPAIVDAVSRRALGHPMGPLELLDFAGLHTHLGSSETAHRELGDPRYRPVPRTRALVRAGATGRAAGRGWYDYEALPPDAARAAAVRERDRTDGSFAVAGPGGELLRRRGIGGGDDTLVLYSAPHACSVRDAAAVRDLLALGARVVVDSSHPGWLEALPERASWIRLHPDAAFAEVVRDDQAAIAPGPAVEQILGALGAASADVPALPGLVADRLRDTLINEAACVVEEGTAGRDDVDTALRLGMNHPAGPFALLDARGAGAVVASLRGMQAGFGDPRYRPAPLLIRRAAGEQRQGMAPLAELDDATVRLPT